MTAASDGAGRQRASDKTQCYERLRARLLEANGTPLAAASAVVLVRQGMSAWMQLDDDQTASRAGIDGARDHSPLPAAGHCELLSALTSLVFHLCSEKESA